jgi:hypothetical protein
LTNIPEKHARDMTPRERRATLEQMHKDRFKQELEARDAADMAAAQKRQTQRKAAK